MRSFDVPELSHSETTPEYVGSLDCVLIATDHSVFDWQEIIQSAQLILDTRNATHSVTSHREKIYKA
jgi:UDP-N-acetyl-D-glucosamine dehydrogenase